MKLPYRIISLLVAGALSLTGYWPAVSAAPDETAPGDGRPVVPLSSASAERLAAASDSGVLYNFAAGLVYEINEDFDNAVARYLEVDKMDPGASQPLIRIGLIALSRGQKEKALETFSRAALKDPENYYPLFLKGTVLSDLGRTQEATDEFERASIVGPDEWLPLLALGELSARQGNFEQAQKAFGSAVSRAPRFSMAWFKLGTVEMKLKNLPKAIEAFEMAVKISPAMLEPRIALALALEKQGNKKRAIEVYKELLKINPLNARVYTRLASLYDEQGEGEEAEQLYEILIELEPRNLSGYLIYGYYLLQKKDYDKALSVIIRGETRHLQSPQLDYLKGTLHLEAGNPEKAVSAFKAALSRYDGDMETDAVYFALGTAYERQDDIGEAAKAFEQALRINPDLAMAHNYLGYMYAEQGVKLDLALEHIDRALELEPDNGAFLDSKGWVLFKLGKTDEALGFLERALEKLPDDEVVLEHLGDVWLEKGKRKKALDFWNKSFKIDNSNKTLMRKIRQKGKRGKR